MTVRLASVAFASLAWATGLSLWIGRGVDLGPVDLQPFQFVTVLLATTWLLRRTRSHRLTERPRDATVRLLAAGLLVALATIATVGMTSVLVADSAWPVIRFVVRYLMGLVTIVALLDLLSTPERLRTLVRAVTFGALASIVLGGAGLAVPALGEITVRSSDRVQAFMNHPNQLAILLTSWMPIVLAGALHRPRRWRAWLTVAVLLAGIGLTGSKFNLLLLAVTVPAYAFVFTALHRGWTKRLMLRLVLTFGLGAAAALAIAVVAQTNPRTLTTLARLAEDPFSTSTVASRQELWSLAISAGNASPVLGIGADHAATVLPHDHAHNVVLHFYLTLGVLGTTALALLFGGIATLVTVTARTAMRMRVAWNLRAPVVALGASLVPVNYVAGNMSSDSFGPATSPLLWVALAVALVSLDQLRTGAPDTSGRAR